MKKEKIISLARRLLEAHSEITKTKGKEYSPTSAEIQEWLNKNKIERVGRPKGFTISENKYAKAKVNETYIDDIISFRSCVLLVIRDLIKSNEFKLLTTDTQYEMKRLVEIGEENQLLFLNIVHEKFSGYRSKL
jgi:hypothetical protein